MCGQLLAEDLAVLSEARLLPRSKRGAERLEAKFPTAALATLELANTTWRQLSQGDAVLAAYVVPKQLG